MLDRHGLTLDPATGEVTEFRPFNTVMSKRGVQVRRDLDRLEAEWNEAHRGASIRPCLSSCLRAEAWAYERPAKEPTTLGDEAAWVIELREAGYDPDTFQRATRCAAVSLDDLSVQEVASRTLDRCAAAASEWTAHAVTEQATRIMTQYRVRATPRCWQRRRTRHDRSDSGSHTLLSDPMSGAAVYVSMTRGKHENQLHIIAENITDARQWFIDAVERDHADRGLTHATQRAVEEVAGLIEHRRKFVSDELAALTQQAATAEAQAERWQQASTACAELSTRETAAREAANRTERQARQRTEQVRVEVAAPFVSAARTALTEWQQAEAAERTASDQVRAASCFGKRRRPRRERQHQHANSRSTPAVGERAG